MNLVVFEQDKAFVKESLRKGTIDYLETVQEGAETDFFKYLNTRGILKHLAETYPLKKKKKEVPTWLYIASDLQMQLFAENHPELNRLTRKSLLHQMQPYSNHLVVYAKQYYAFFDAPEYTELVMKIEEPGKSKLLRKVRRIRRAYLGGLKFPRSP